MAITYGMSVKDFWENDPNLFWAYRFSYFTKIKTEQEVSNRNAWLQGAYFYEAISVSLNNAFNKSKLDYSSEPYKFEEDSEKVKQEKMAKLSAQIRGRMNKIKQLKDSKETIIKGESRV